MSAGAVAKTGLPCVLFVQVFLDIADQTTKRHDARRTINNKFIVIGKLMSYFGTASHSNSKQTNTPVGILLFVALFVIDALLPSQQRNMDGCWTQSRHQGISDAKLSHILYTILGVPYFQLWRILGYPGDAAYPLIMLNALCAAFGICGFYLFLKGVAFIAILGAYTLCIGLCIFIWLL